VTVPRTRITLPALALLLALVASAPSPAAERSVPRGFYGVNWDGDIQRRYSAELVDREWIRMAVTGAESSRTSFEWHWAQPEPGGPFDHSRTDPIVGAAAARGVKLLPIVIWAPPWARRDAQTTFSPPARPAEYAAYLTELIGRYGPRGSFWTEHPELPKRPVRAWQIWNEPHLPYQWTIPDEEDWAAEYGRLLRVAHAAVKRADPGAKVVLAGLTNVSWDQMRSLYARGRIRRRFDVAAVHPYTRTPDGVVEIARRFRKVMRGEGDGRKPIWITELGLPASKGKAFSPSPLQTSPRGMARFLRGSYARLARARRSSATRVNRAYWYTWSSEYCCAIFRYAGLLRFDPADDSVSSQPAFSAYRRMARRHQGCAKGADGACARR
jgi:Glycosyl hydrolase catalytic core